MRNGPNRKAPPPHPIGSILLALFLAVTFGGAAANEIPLDASGLPLWEVRTYNDFPVRIEVGSYEELEAMRDGAPVAGFHRGRLRVVWETPKEYHLVIEPRITDEEARALIGAGYSFETLPDAEQEVRREMERIWAEQAAEGGDRLEKGDRGVYHTHAQIGDILYQTMLDHPAIADTFIIGNSVQGRDIWGIRISNNIGSEEAEPEVRMSSTMHGNEPPGLEMLLYLVEFLTDEYASDPDAAFLVDNFEMHIIPCHNPDGLVVNSRYNANGIDLNRNFPVPDGSIGGDGTWTEEIETRKFKDHGFAHHFVISENGHSGALVVNYPWDYTYDLTPDDAAIQLLSLEYSTYNLPMYNGAFPQGITNGAQWYIIKGGLQDWSYHETGCIDVTIEYSNAFAPPASTLDAMWEDDNKQSFIHWIQTASYGVNGIVTGSDTGLPLDATVAVTGIDKDVYTDPDFGDYYKLLDSGSYDITYSASGYISETHCGVSTTWGTPTVLNVDLDPVAYGDVSGWVREVGGGAGGLDADIAIRTYPGDVYVTTVQSDAGSGGAYTAHLMYGQYNFHVTSQGHTSADRVVTVDEPTESEDFLLGIVNAAILFEDDFEGGSSQWSGGWSITSSSSYSPTRSMTDSPGGNYADRDTNECVMALDVDLTQAESCSLSFWAKWDIEDNWDCCVLEISDDGGSSWTPLATNHTVAASGQGAQKPTGIPVFEGTQSAWVENVVDLAAWQTESDVRFRFRMKSDTSINEDGFYFDDIAVWGVQVVVGVGGSAPVVTRLLGNAPNPFNPTTVICYELGKPAVVDLGVYDVTGRLVRRLASSEPLGAGLHEATWDGRTDSGAEAASGLYLYRIYAGNLREVRKMMLIR